MKSEDEKVLDMVDELANDTSDETPKEPTIEEAEESKAPDSWNENEAMKDKISDSLDNEAPASNVRAMSTTDTFSGSAPAKKKGKATGALVLILILAVVVVAGIFLWPMITENMNGNNGENGTNESQEEVENEAEEDEDTVLETFVSDFTGFAFDYPEDWVINTARSTNGDVIGHTTTITSPLGSILQLRESNGGGVGGWCDPEEHEDVSVRFFGATNLKSSHNSAPLTVIDYGNENGGALHLSNIDISSRQMMNPCALRFSNFLNIEGMGDHTFIFEANTDAMTEEDFTKMVAILLSSRLEN